MKSLTINRAIVPEYLYLSIQICFRIFVCPNIHIDSVCVITVLGLNIHCLVAKLGISLYKATSSALPKETHVYIYILDVCSLYKVILSVRVLSHANQAQQFRCAHPLPESVAVVMVIRTQSQDARHA